MGDQASYKEKIYEALKETRDNEKARPITISQLGKCVRSLWYGQQGAPQGELPGRSIAVFQFGDAIEELAIQWIETTGVRVINRQMEVTLQGTIQGHIDGVLKEPDRRMIDIKSSSEIGFKYKPGYSKMETLPEDDSYWLQVQGYLNSDYAIRKGIDRLLLFVVNKNTCHIAEIEVTRDPSALEIIQWKMEQASGDSVPERPYLPEKDKKGKWMLKFPCSYCAHMNTCYENIDVGFTSGGAPTFEVVGWEE